MTTLYHDDEDSPFDERGFLRDDRSATVRMSMRDGGDRQRQLRIIDASGDPLGLHRPGFRVRLEATPCCGMPSKTLQKPGPPGSMSCAMLGVAHQKSRARATSPELTGTPMATGSLMTTSNRPARRRSPLLPMLRTRGRVDDSGDDGLRSAHSRVSGRRISITASVR
jgi:hypothetical protein